MQQVIVTLVTLQKDRQVMKSELQPILVGLYNMLQYFLAIFGASYGTVGRLASSIEAGSERTIQVHPEFRMQLGHARAQGQRKKMGIWPPKNDEKMVI